MNRVIWKCINAYILETFHMLVINRSTSQDSWSAINAYILESDHRALMYVVNLSRWRMVWSYIYWYIMKSVIIPVLFVANQRKKSHYDKSGDLGGHGTTPKREMRRPGNMFRRMFIGACAVWRWGYLKDHVYTHKPRNLNEFKDAIWQEVLTIDQQLLARALDDFKRRIENCIQEDVVT